MNEKEYVKLHSKDFKKDSAETFNNMLRARSDLESTWKGQLESNKESLLNFWYNKLSEKLRTQILDKSRLNSQQLAVQYGIIDDSITEIIPELTENYYHKIRTEFHNWVENVLESTLDGDIRFIEERYRVLTDNGVELPVVKLTRKATQQIRQYDRPHETIWWFAVLRRLILSVFVLEIIQNCNELGILAAAKQMKTSNTLQTKPTGSKSECAFCRKQITCKSCSRCSAIWYCGRECQVADWKRHKQDCSPK